ncbi:MAG: excinuclease ABC subunit UvrC [Erysipelotrichaceae bacterium]|nr:excinuclease ABC subunit UvrC [Erysipelotrichaceae bacterium]
MTELLKLKLASLPMEPGCYLMKNSHGEIIYVGKAKKLKNRVNSYFTGAHNFKTTKLVSQIADFDIIVTSSEKEALLLEINLIKKHRPRFNIMFMDDKSYPYIKITTEKYPTCQVVREFKKQKNARYFGPYPDATAAYQTQKLLNRLYPLRKCKVMPKKVCLYYHIGQCLGPCEFEIPEETYKDLRNSMIRFLQGDVKELLERLKNEMNEAAEQLEFEKAKEKYELIQSIEHIVDRQNMDQDDRVDRDVFNYHVTNGYIAIFGLFVRSGKVLERELVIETLVEDPEETFISFVAQYYLKNPVPKQVCLPLNLDVNLLSEVLDCTVVQPVRGKLKKLIELAKVNAQTNLERQFSTLEQRSTFHENAVSQLKELLHLPVLDRIEVFDISHLSGSYTVGGMVVYEDHRFKKSDYRRFRLSTGNSDSDSMKEVLYRRYFKVKKEGLRAPDLILMDGGLVQINACLEILSMLQMDIPVAGLVKDDAHQTSNLLFQTGEILPMNRKSDVFFLLTQIQDEVHRYAVTYHKLLRDKAMTISILDEIDGVGPKRKKDLMNHFRSFKKLKEASEQEIAQIVPGAVAHEIFMMLHQSQAEDSFIE